MFYGTLFWNSHELFMKKAFIQFLPISNAVRLALKSASFCCFLLTSLPGLPWLMVTLAMTGKFFVSIGFAIIYVYTAEMYPTPVRTIGLGAGSMFARLGSLLAPFVADLVSMLGSAMAIMAI